MAKNRGVLKECVKCARTESKSCRNKSCRNFTKQTKPSIKKSAKDDPTIRRTKRERKQNPKFTDAEKPSENKNAKNRANKRPKPVSTEITPRRSQRNTEEARAARANLPKRKVPMHGGVDMCGQLSKEKQELAALFLSEINRKLSSAVWRI